MRGTLSITGRDGRSTFGQVPRLGRPERCGGRHTGEFGRRARSQPPLPRESVMWWRRRHEDRRPVRVEGERLPDGDTVLFPGQSKRWTELLDETRELPAVRWSPANPAPTASTDLVRRFVLGKGKAS
jgi:hypothetical protein